MIRKMSRDFTGGHGYDEKSRSPTCGPRLSRTAIQRLSDPLGDVRLDLFVFREPSLLELGVDEVAVDGDLESAAAGGNQGEGLDVLLEFLNDTFRHTDGLGFIASRRAVFDPDFGHLLSPPSPCGIAIRWMITYSARGVNSWFDVPLRGR